MLSVRSLCSFSVAVLLCVTSPHAWGNDASSKEAVFEYIPSKLGIDYRELAPYPLGAMLSQGEVEFRETATSIFGEETKVAWLELSTQIATGGLSRYHVKGLRKFTPNMLSMFAAGLSPQDKKYGGLWSVGNAYIASKLAEAVKTIE